MKRKYLHPSKELMKLFNQEWARARKILSPLLDRKEKPKFYVCKNLRYGWAGIHFGRDGILMHKINNRWIRTAHVIAIREDLNNPIGTIQHEICHVLENNHKAKFKNLRRLLV